MESVDEKRKRLQEKLKNREFSARILESLSYEKSIGEDFFYKKEEYNEIENYIEDYLSTGIAENFIIEGQRGTGKTSVTRFLCQDTKKLVQEIEGDDFNIGIYEVNCREYSTISTILPKIMNKNGRGTAKGQHIGDFKDFISNNDRTIIILDEIDVLQDMEVIYTLSRTEDIMIIGTGLTMFHFENKLKSDTSAKSTFKYKSIQFVPFKANELVQIFEKRLMHVYHYEKLTDAFNLNVTSYSGILYNRYEGDSRLGIFALRLIVTKEEDFDFNKEYEIDYLREIFNKYLQEAEAEIEKDELSPLDKTQFYALFSIAYTNWKETVIEASSEQLKISNANQDVYIYKRYTPINLSVD